MLTKTRTILETDGEIVGYEDVADNEFDGVKFTSSDAHEEPENRSDSAHTQLILPVSIWRELGEPKEITLGVWNKDTLND